MPNLRMLEYCDGASLALIGHNAAAALIVAGRASNLLEGAGLASAAAEDPLAAAEPEARPAEAGA